MASLAISLSMGPIAGEAAQSNPATPAPIPAATSDLAPARAAERAPRSGEETAPPIAVESSYVLTPGDSIQVTVFQEEELSRMSRVGENGAVYLPLIGMVKLGGLTVPQAVQTVEELLRKDYLVNPQVTISVMQFATKQITILGQVARPGVYEIPARQNVDVLQAIGMAGGYTRIASPSRITVKRNEGGQESVFKVDGKRMASREGEGAFSVMPGDVITVGESIF